MATICQLHADLRYYLCLEPVDMRKQFQGLQGIVNAEFGRYLTQDEAFVFIGKSRKMVKILHRESNGLTMYVRKLATGRFRMPELNTDRRTCTMNYSEFVRLILGEKWEIEGHFDENGRRLQTA
ncbi:MAG: IS66 family insertion sequence element accessory protein TnpB [Bacteroidales bacterium]|jgi:transposase|nr:IS66 family insertion sequence element accessory protein TnpB [Bacteroidales bacterium]MBR4492713.1 IS66 family insertion sequence element accessory protein TnpB [Bacteroidales bacterium]